MDFTFNSAQAHAALTLMLTIRLFESKIESLFSSHIMHGTTHLAIGQEAVHAGVSPALDREDWIVTTHRCHGHTLAKGASLQAAFAEFFGYSDGLAHGLGGSMHLVDVEHHNAGSSAVVGSGVPLATGMALQLKRKKSNQLVVALFGDGASSRGAVHESMNIASVMSLPVLFLCEHNMYGMSACAKDMVSIEYVSDRGKAYAIESTVVDGNDVEQVYKAVSDAAHYIRSTGKPYLLETRTYRFSGHSKSDKRVYRTREEEVAWLKRDPIEMLKQRMLQRTYIDEKDFEELGHTIQSEIDNIVDEMIDHPRQLSIEEAFSYVYSSKEHGQL